MAASNDELTGLTIILTDQIQTLSNRLNIAEQNAMLQAQGGSRGGDSGVFSKKKLYPKDFEASPDAGGVLQGHLRPIAGPHRGVPQGVEDRSTRPP